MNKGIILLIIVLLVFLLDLLTRISRKEVVKEQMTTRQLAYIVMFGALSAVVGFFEIPIGITGAKFDFSEVIILAAFYILGFKNVSFIIILRSVIRLMLPAKGGMEDGEIVWKLFGEIIAIIASYIIIFSYVIYKKIFKKKEKPLLYECVYESQKPKVINYVVLSTLSAFLLSTLLMVFHVFVTVRVWGAIFGPGMFGNKNVTEIIVILFGLFGVLNIVKGLLTPIIFLMVKPQLEKIMR